MRKQRETGYGLAAVLLLSLLLLWIWTGFEEEAFLIDDNRTQWYPVMEKAYEDVLEGKIYYDVVSYGKQLFLFVMSQNRM